MARLEERVLALKDVFEEREIDFLLDVSREVEDVRGKVVYAGSGGDVEHAVILGDVLIFIDSHLPETTLCEIRRGISRVGGRVIREKRIGELGKGGKHLIEFEFLGDKIRIFYYAEDATEFVPDEAKDGFSVYFVKVPHPKEMRVGSLTSPKSLSLWLSLLRVGGYYLERECPLCLKLRPEDLGFVKVTSGYISALSVKNELGNLYKKVRDVENLYELLVIDRDGMPTNV